MDDREGHVSRGMESTYRYKQAATSCCCFSRSDIFVQSTPPPDLNVKEHEKMCKMHYDGHGRRKPRHIVYVECHIYEASETIQWDKGSSICISRYFAARLMVSPGKMKHSKM